MYDKEDEYGYDLVIWNSEPYTLQDDDKEYNLKKGDRVVNVTNLYRVDKRQNWYSSSSTQQIIKLLHVVVSFIDISTDSLPRGFTSKSVKGNYMGKMSDKCHDFILDEINRRDRLNYVEDCVNFSYDTDDESI